MNSNIRFIYLIVFSVTLTWPVNSFSKTAFCSFETISFLPSFPIIPLRNLIKSPRLWWNGMLSIKLTISKFDFLKNSLNLFKTFFNNPDNTYWQNSLLSQYTLEQWKKGREIVNIQLKWNYLHLLYYFFLAFIYVLL